MPRLCWCRRTPTCWHRRAPEDEWTVEARARLVELYEAWDKPEQASRYR